MSERLHNYLLDQIESASRALAQQQELLALAWDAGYDARRVELDKQAADPSYPIHRPNPFVKEAPHV
ncbi:hypothetical protein P5G50_18425 [Leifsonia sp. F6_8S_P_1B]|uniref:Uncharacterized protein n=1 Tax=Leifsonia williamsii TaxID=3035919 RepID=A0ABT8KG68_9MICO|nr:hypothetical protein [Leifsonia williamsii]MDN4616428.1 hypothetical protein [Leifsonia williamsii]